MTFAARLLAVPLGLGYVLWQGGNGWDLLIALLSGGAVAAGTRWPMPVLAAQSALLVLAHEFGVASGIGVKIWAAVALFEVALRCGLRWQIGGALLLCAGYAGLEFVSQTGSSVPVPYRIGLLVALPWLAGRYVDALRRRAEQAERTAELSAETARRDERETIARDLHDVVAHHVSAILVRVGMARHVPELAPAETARLLDDIHGTAEAALSDLHALLHVLRGGPARPTSELLDAALDTAARAGMTVRADIDPALRALDGQRGVALYRTIQEGITNAVKHSGTGAQLSVTARMDPAGAVDLTIANDRTHPNPTGGGFGLAGMRDRLETVGGTLDYGPDGAGWRLHAALPKAAAR